MRGFIVPAIVAVATIAPAPASAAVIRPFSPQAFGAAQRAGRPILVDVHADWCPVCRAQDQALGPLLKRNEFKNLVVLRLDFDSQRQYWRSMGVRQQSTLIVFKGRNEVARAVAETDTGAIAELIRTAIR